MNSNIFCSFCGAKNTQDNKFCINCGEALEKLEKKEKSIDAPYKSSTYVSGSYDAYPPTARVQQQPKRKSTPIGIILAIIFFFVPLIIFLIVFFTIFRGVM